MTKFKAHTVVIAAVVMFSSYGIFYGADRKGSPATGRGSAHVHAAGIKYYHTLEKLYLKWHDGLFGSRKFHERALKDFLNDLRGENIRSDYNYIIDNDAGKGVNILCRFRGCRWLNFHGPVDGDSLKRVTGGNRKKTGSWWRGTDLLAVSGKVVRYRLGRNRYGDTITIYLDKIYLHADE